jgi:hypothetical protein
MDDPLYGIANANFRALAQHRTTANVMQGCQINSSPFAWDYLDKNKEY